jgi:predicted ArsR family transcriptional regulator
MAEAVEQAADNAARIVIEAWPPVASDDLGGMAEVLGELGYEPRVEDDEMRLANCPFERLAAEHRDLVCGLNLTFVTSVGERLGCTDVEVSSHRAGPGCCARVSTTDAAPRES